jgi:outer membrane protein W
MRINNKIFCFLLFLAAVSSVSGQNNGNKFAFSLNYNYTTTSKLYLQPKSSDEFLRGIHSFLDNISGYGFELRYKVSDAFFLGLGAEYIERKGKITTVSVVIDHTQNILVDDGYRVFPVELTGYYLFPFSLERFKFYMGGGVGYYFGSHIREIGDIKSETVERETSYGIHILVALDFLVTDYFSLRGSVKFRDVEFTMFNKYNKVDGTLDGYPVKILTESFDSKVALDGIVFNIGLTFHF